MKNTTIAFIGGGNMARSLIGGLIGAGVEPAMIRVADPDERQLQTIAAQFGVRIFTENTSAADAAAVVVLAVKPQVLKDVARGLADKVQAQLPLILSIAAGVRETDVRRWLGGDVAVVRTMPNTPALVRSGATALYANELVNVDQRDLAESIMRAVGITLWVRDEAQMDAVTALSGSGPAYFLLVMEVLAQAGVELGLSADTARLLALETAFGTAKLALESAEDASVLRARVTSPGGTTEQGIKVLQEGDIGALFARALKAAQQRSVELANEFGAD